MNGICCSAISNSGNVFPSLCLLLHKSNQICFNTWTCLFILVWFNVYRYYGKGINSTWENWCALNYCLFVWQCQGNNNDNDDNFVTTTYYSCNSCCSYRNTASYIPYLFIFVPTTEIFSKAVVAVATPIALTTTTKLGSMSFKFKIYCTLSCITLTRNKTNSKPSSAVATTIATTIATTTTTTTKVGSMSFKSKTYCTLSCITLTRYKTNGKPLSCLKTKSKVSLIFF